MAPCDAMEPASSRPPIEKTLRVVWCPEASQSGWDLERDLEDEEEIERLRL